GISEFHQHGGDLIWQIGTGYFGCRDEAGNFNLSRFKECVERNSVTAIEIKLSQGAKPGLGGMLPAAKITPEISKIRGIPMGQDCASPSTHSAFHDADSLLDFVEMLADESGLPVGIKSAVGESQVWKDLARLMDTTGRGVDFITVDGGEGGTGAAPLVFSDHVALPFKLGFTRVYREFFERGIHNQIVFVGSGKLGFPATAILAFALGCDMVHVAREPMLSIGCIQAARCHTGHCPTGIATQNRWLMRGLDPTHKGARLANYIVTLRKEILQLSRACGVPHPSLVTADQCEIIDEKFGSVTARELFKLAESLDYGLPSDEQRKTILDLPPLV
ncbi:MAG: glutamate synthase domain-containing protein 2, partial [Porticoccaceae bacterium]